MDPGIVVMQLLLGGILGMTGQGVRVIVGLKKVHEQAEKDKKQFGQVFSTSTLVISLIIGFVSGVLALISMAGTDSDLVDQSMMIAVLGAGYAGTDFIEGFMKKNMPGQ